VVSTETALCGVGEEGGRVQRAKNVVRARSRRAYGVSAVEVEAFVCEHRIVARWLGKYRDVPATYEKYSRYLCMFFKWLQLRGLSLGPEEFLKELAARRGSRNPVDWSWGKFLLRASLLHERSVRRADKESELGKACRTG
jgi:hypothetical protein